MMRVVLGLLVVGGRRLRHLGYLSGDPIFERFSGLAQLPSARTLSRWLKNFNEAWVGRLRRVNAEVVARVVRHLPLKLLAVDVDGTVCSTGLQVERARRGYNPHHRKVPSYYPITAHLGETGHILRVKIRSGNIHDGKASLFFLRGLFAQIRDTLGPLYRLRFHLDGAFSRQDVVALLEARDAGYAIKVPFFSGLAFATIPTNHYGANSAWQQLVALAHNLLTNFQIEGGAAKRSRGFRATAFFVLKSAQTLRFEIFHRAGLLLRPNGAIILRLAANPQVRDAFTAIACRLPQVA